MDHLVFSELLRATRSGFMFTGQDVWNEQARTRIHGSASCQLPALSRILLHAHHLPPPWLGDPAASRYNAVFFAVGDLVSAAILSMGTFCMEDL